MSIGCGNMIDYWALAQNMSEDTVINYQGYDCIDWSYKVQKREKLSFVDYRFSIFEVRYKK